MCWSMGCEWLQANRYLSSKAKDANGEFCPDDSASHNCPVHCPEDQTLCPGHTNSLGCKGADECKDKAKDANGNYCPDTSVCHTACNLHEISCPGGMDVNGCKTRHLSTQRKRL